jgi:hypothetical protein
MKILGSHWRISTTMFLPFAINILNPMDSSFNSTKNQVSVISRKLVNLQKMEVLGRVALLQGATKIRRGNRQEIKRHLFLSRIWKSKKLSHFKAEKVLRTFKWPQN